MREKKGRKALPLVRTRLKGRKKEKERIINMVDGSGTILDKREIPSSETEKHGPGYDSSKKEKKGDIDTGTCGQFFPARPDRAWKEKKEGGKEMDPRNLGGRRKKKGKKGAHS